MKYFTEYQLTEIFFGTLYFIILYSVGSIIINGTFDLIDILITSVIFLIWYSLTKIMTNYFVFINID